MVGDAATKRKVLLVDDDALTISIISRVLRNAGYETAEARSGDEALAVASEFQPNLALLDITMPGMSGIELSQRLQEKAEVPFMFISAHAEADIVKKATEYGAVGYLLKPFDIAQVLPALEAAWGRADDIARLRNNEINLTNALNAGREASMAVGLLMSKYGSDRDAAFEVLRIYARSHRRKINDIAESLLAAEEMNNAFKRMFLRQSVV